MRKIKSLFVMLMLFGSMFIVLPSLTVTVGASDYAGGDGSAGSPFQISNWTHLNNVRNNLSMNFTLTANLISGTDGYDTYASSSANGGLGWLPIGNSSDEFIGTFDGNNYTIDGLYINRNISYVGLIGVLAYGGWIKDVGVTNANVTGKESVGVLVGYTYQAYVNNSYSTGDVNTTTNNIGGGLVGTQWYGSINNCYSHANVTVYAGNQAGGLIGWMIDSAIVTNSYSTGNVKGIHYVGGFVGASASGATITNCFWDMETSGQTTSAGGVGLVTIEMNTLSTFTDASWDITYSSIYRNDGYPFLGWEINNSNTWLISRIGDEASVYFNFYDSTTGIGIENTMFKIFVGTTSSLTSSDRIYRDTYYTNIGTTLYYRIDDYFDNQIYPTVGDSTSFLCTSKNYFVDIPITWNSFSVKNMNSSIVHFNLTNDTRSYTQFIFPYDSLYLNVLSGNYDVNITYYNPAYSTPAPEYITGYENTSISITSDSYYWIRGYDLQDIIIEITNTNTSILDQIINIGVTINNDGADIINQTINLSFYLSNLETNIVNQINDVWFTVNNTNSTIISQVNLVRTDISNMETNITTQINDMSIQITNTESNLTTQINAVQTSITNTETNITTQLNAIGVQITTTESNITTQINAVQVDIQSVNTSIHTQLNAILASITTTNSSLVNQTNLIMSAINTFENNITGTVTVFWGTVNESFGILQNRSTVIFNIYNTNEGLGLDRETLLVYINGSRLINNIYYCTNNTVLNLTVTDYYNFTMYQGNLTVNATFMFVDLGLTFHSWLFGNKNDDYYMVSLLRDGASRWWERGIVPYGEREFMLPSGNYTLRIYDDSYTELHNASYTVNNSRVYVIHGTNLSEIISGLSVIRGQLLEIQTDFEHALRPDAVIWTRNPMTIFSIFDRIGQQLGSSVWEVCPMLQVIAETRSNNYSNAIVSSALVPGTSTSNGTIEVIDDIIYFSSNATVTWVNITYINGTTLQNTSYIPSQVRLDGETVYINSSGNIYISRETIFSSSTTFYWNIYNSTINPGHITGRGGYHSAGITIINPLDTPLYNVYVYAGFSDRTTPDYNTVNITDIDNGVYVTAGEDFKVTGSGIEFRIQGGMTALEEREFLMGYYSSLSHTYYYEDAQIVVRSYTTEQTLSGYSELFNRAEFMWINSNNLVFRGSLRVKFDFKGIVIDTGSIVVFDLDNNRVVDDDYIITGNDYILLSSGVMGTVQQGGTRRFAVYFLEELYPGHSIDEYYLSTPLFTVGGLMFSTFTILILLSLVLAGFGLVLILREGGKVKDKYLLLVVLGFAMAFIFWILQAKGV